MNDSLYRISLDIHSTQSQVSIPVTQFDTARGILVTLTEGGKPYMLSDDCRAAFTGTKADENTLYNDCIILNNSVIRYDFTEQTTAAIGIVDAAIKVFGADNKVLTSPRLTLLVYEDTVGFVTPSTTELGIIDRIVQNDATQDANMASMSAELLQAQKDITIANSQITLAKYDINTVNRNLSIAQTGIDNAKTDIAQAQSDIAQAQTDIDQVKSDIEKMTSSETTMELANTQMLRVFGGDFSGTTYTPVPCNIPAGSYTLHIDRIETSDTDAETSQINFVKNNTVIKASLYQRNTPTNVTIDLASDIDTIRMYASVGYNESVGDAFTVHGFKLLSNTVLNQRITDLEKMVSVKTSTIDLSRLDDGEIVETFSDGSTKTTTIEYDADGNPVKITDGDGNVTDLTW